MLLTISIRRSTQGWPATVLPRSAHGYCQKQALRFCSRLTIPLSLTAWIGGEYIYYKDEEQLRADARDAGATYHGEVLPAKMRYNLEGIRKFCGAYELRVMGKTLAAVTKK